MNKTSFSFKVIWAENYIGIAVDILPKKNSSLPLTTFYFWPKEDGWELLKSDLESKPWLTSNQKIEILNGFTKILDFWLNNASTNILKVFHYSTRLNFKLLASV